MSARCLASGDVSFLSTRRAVKQEFSMTNTIISGLNFILVDGTGNVNNAGFNLVSGDTVTVIGGGVIIASGVNTTGVHSSGETVIDNAARISGGQFGVDILQAVPASPEFPNLTNEAGGVIAGGDAGIRYTGENILSLTNDGAIYGTGFGASNLVTGAIDIESGTLTLVNRGTISAVASGPSIKFAGTSVGGTILNSGSMADGITSMSLSAGITVFNTGSIGGINASAGTNFSYTGGGGTVGAIAVTNTGTSSFGGIGTHVLGSIQFNSAGGATFDGNGVNVVGDVVLSDSTTGDIVNGLAGGLIAGSLITRIGDDTVDTTGGTVKGFIDLGAGNDTFTGGDAVDKVIGGAGNDTLDLGGGNDRYTTSGMAISDGNDDIDGGAGMDVYVASTTGTTGLTVDLLDGIATGISFGTDHLLNFENAIGSQFADTLTGDNNRNVLAGSAGVDTLNGLAGNDRLIGGIGGDVITGGLGQDVMTGGATIAGNDGARDTFFFTTLADSGPTAGTRDWITDFSNGALAISDRINLAAMDANSLVAGDQVFTWQAVAGAAFTGVAGQLHYVITAGNTYIAGDVNGDKVADFSIALTGGHALAATDFIL
jgi:RTX calcium-binding nonapeptide repeat (4 copies)